MLGVPALASVPWNQFRERSRWVGERIWLSFCRSSQTISVGPILASPPAADSLPGAEGLDGHAVVERDAVVSPRRPDGGGRVVRCQRLVFDQFGLDVFQMGAGLVFRVGDDPDVRLDFFQRRLEHEGERAERRFRGPARGEDVELLGMMNREKERQSRRSLLPSRSLLPEGTCWGTVPIVVSTKRGLSPLRMLRSRPADGAVSRQRSAPGS